MTHRGEINYLVIFSAAAILIIIAALWGYLAILAESQEESVIETYELSEEFYNGPDPIAQELLTYHRDNLSEIEINVLLDSTFELLVSEDITADERREIVVVKKNPFRPAPHRILREDGYTRTIDGMIIYRKIDESLVPVFILTPEAIRDERGNILTGQVHAAHGYALQVYDFEDEDIYPQRVKLFDIVLLDEHGQAASDDITIYWNPASGLYRATNTFGAPGTFGE